MFKFSDRASSAKLYMYTVGHSLLHCLCACAYVWASLCDCFLFQNLDASIVFGRQANVQSELEIVYISWYIPWQPYLVLEFKLKNKFDEMCVQQDRV